MIRFAAALVALCTFASPVLAAEDTQEKLASDSEVAKVNETLAKIGCKAAEVEKETASLFEVDDAECAIGQYDIKLDGDFTIVSMTKDF